MKTKQLSAHKIDHWLLLELIRQHESPVAFRDPEYKVLVEPSHWTQEECNEWLAVFDPHEKPFHHYGDEIGRRVTKMKVHRPKGKVIYTTPIIVDPETFGKRNATESGTTGARVNLYYFDVVDIYNQMRRKMPKGGSKEVVLDFVELLKRPRPAGFENWPNGLRSVYMTASEGVQKRKRVSFVHDINDANILAKLPKVYAAEESWWKPDAAEEAFLKWLKEPNTIGRFLFDDPPPDEEIIDLATGKSDSDEIELAWLRVCYSAFMEGRTRR